VPVSETEKIRERKRLVLEALRRLNGVGTLSDIMKIVNSMDSNEYDARKIYYVLRKLELEGIVRKKKYGKTAVWYLVGTPEEVVVKYVERVRASGNYSRLSSIEYDSRKVRKAEILLDNALDILSKIMHSDKLPSDIYDELRRAYELVEEARRRLTKS